MTAEIAIMNRGGIALAADSAVTIGQDRVWKNSNKLFHLAPCADVGVMVYGNGSHCGLPWEVLIKQYRKQLGRKSFPKLSEYAEDFRRFLDELDTPHPIQSELNTYTLVMNVISDVMHSLKEAGEGVDFEEVFLPELEEIVSSQEEQPLVFSDLTLDKFKKLHSEAISSLLSEKFELEQDSSIPDELLRACYEICIRAVPSGAETGVVFAGFGEEELLPVVYEITVDGMLDGEVRTWTNRVRDSNDDDNGGMVIPFAQSDIAYLFIEGLLPEFLDFMGHTMQGALERKCEELIDAYVPEDQKIVETKLQQQANEKMTDSFMDGFEEFRRASFVHPMMKVISSLPKEEMAAVAEALVETTSLRRKMDSKLETVGGPVDVAIISKSDGFVWIKRKHYFDIELNRDFVQRRHDRFSGEK